MLRRAITTLAAIVALIFVVKVMVAPSTTAADNEAMKASFQNTMSIYDLHVRHPAMKSLAEEKIPLP
ncbi:MAG TPA: hypothetical protein VIV34_03540 [Pseudolabrys sp.]